MQSLRQFAQVPDRGRASALAASSSASVAGSASVAESPPKQLQRDPERHEPLLRPIVEVPFDPPPLRVLRLGQPGADALTASSWARTSAWSRSFSTDRRTAATAADTSPGSSRRAGS